MVKYFHTNFKGLVEHNFPLKTFKLGKVILDNKGSTKDLFEIKEKC